MLATIYFLQKLEQHKYVILKYGSFLVNFIDFVYIICTI
jgi:hypothetical protein